MTNLFIRKLSRRVRMSDADIEALSAATSKMLYYDADHDLTQEGSKPEFAYVILDGFACRYRIMQDGSRSILAYLVPGDGCDLHASILTQMVHSIGTLTPCTVATIPYRVIKELAAYRPNVYLALWWSVLVDESILQEWLVSVGRRSSDKQLAHFLCEVLTRLQAVGLALEPDYRIPLKQSELADTAGLSHVHVQRVLSDLRKAKLIEVGRKGLVVPDLERLKAFAEFKPDYLHLSHLDEAPPPPAPLDLANATKDDFEKRFGRNRSFRDQNP
ncbi:Transcriptional activatory protein AadR [Methylobacterium crusticola]|uniref:Transcriptional activatory protein AadR n=1 Tax=Methylobacterium crusticola TaxID=1697972 RepID=A0ABQ4QXF5_9HYPH|nr:Crp/Fnr family transcriptional regulator [Methylobacterium crusticola]GJD50048.1 Transcriptional activatory protein AadR [Methylobacterium crusticola]